MASPAGTRKKPPHRRDVRSMRVRQRRQPQKTLVLHDGPDNDPHDDPLRSLQEHVADIERRLTLIGFARQPTDDSRRGQRWGLPPQPGELRLHPRASFDKAELCWYPLPS